LDNDGAEGEFRKPDATSGRAATASEPALRLTL